MIEINRDPIREDFLRYTRAAFKLLPPMVAPQILDVGCGSGVPTLELARLSDGYITALDIDPLLLEKLVSKARALGLTDRITPRKASIIGMDFPEESFDVIWAEGSIALIGFKQGLEQWRRFLKPKGFLAVHDDTGDIAEKLRQITDCGYELVGYFVLTSDIWWNQYYHPLQQLVDEVKLKQAGEPDVMAAIARDQQEIDKVRLMSMTEPILSVFFVMQKTD